MANKTTPLNDSQIRATKAPTNKSELVLSDGGGLQIHIRATGARLWRLRYQDPVTGKRVLYALGKYPDLTLAKAREKRAEALTMLADKKDPRREWEAQLRKQQTEIRNTFKQVAIEWLEVHRSRVSEDYATDTLRSLELHLFPHIGRRPVAELTTRCFIDALQPLKTQGKFETLRRVSQRARKIMTHAVINGLVESNPVVGISQVFEAPKEKHFPTLKPEQLPEFMQALAHASITLTTRMAIEFQLHTMTRPKETALARWDEIDLERKLWVIPAEKMGKNKRAHTIPLSEQALNMLDIMQSISSDSEWVFPAARDQSKPMCRQAANAAIKRMGYASKLVSHGLRSIGSTTLNEQGFDPDVIEIALSHVDKNAVRRAYNRAEYLERRRVMLQWWSDFITDASKGSVSLGNYKHLRVVSE